MVILLSNIVSKPLKWVGSEERNAASKKRLVPGYS